MLHCRYQSCYISALRPIRYTHGCHITRRIPTLNFTSLHHLSLVAGDFGVEGGEGDREGLERANRVLQVHRELVLTHTAELRNR